MISTSLSLKQHISVMSLPDNPNILLTRISNLIHRTLHEVIMHIISTNDSGWLKTVAATIIT